MAGPAATGYIPAMTGFPIRCPSCGQDYLLPGDLLGAAGARVRCPRCTQAFLVDGQGRVSESAPAVAPPPPAAPPPPMAAAAPAAPFSSAPPAATTPSPAATAEPAAAAPASAAPEPSHSAHARAALEALVTRVGEDLFAAAREQRLFRDHGPALFEAFDEYRRRAGREAGVEPFRIEIRRLLGEHVLPTIEALS